jgi:hypothetical protein
MEEFIERLRARRDIFAMEGNAPIKWTEGICMTLALILGMWLNTRHALSRIDTDFVSTKPPQANSTIRIVDQPFELSPKQSAIVPQTERPKLVNSPRHATPYSSSRNHGGFGIKGAIWWQGEDDALDYSPNCYYSASGFKKLIRD